MGETREKAMKNVARTAGSRYEAAREQAAKSSYSAPGAPDADAAHERPSRPH
jgi:hypothetical protein